MKRRHWFLVIFSLLVVNGCSNEDSYARKLITKAFDRSAAVHFVEFTRFDEKNACFEVRVRNYDRREKTVYVALSKDNAAGQEWNRWATAESLEDCRGAIK